MTVPASRLSARIVHPDEASEFPTRERCAILEAWNTDLDPAVSIARARVAPGVTTELHTVDVDERYVIVGGAGEVRIDGLASERVAAGDVVVIPAGTAQQVANVLDEDLVFYCICSPRFRRDAYHAVP